ERYVTTTRAEGDLHRVGQLVHATFERPTRVLVKIDLLGHEKPQSFHSRCSGDFARSVRGPRATTRPVPGTAASGTATHERGEKETPRSPAVRESPGRLPRAPAGSS